MQASKTNIKFPSPFMVRAGVRVFLLLFIFALSLPTQAQNRRRGKARSTRVQRPKPKVRKVDAPQSILDWAAAYKAPGLKPDDKCKVVEYYYNAAKQTVYIEMNETFGLQQWKSDTPKRIYDEVRRLLPANQRNAKIRIVVDFDTRTKTDNRPIEHLAPYAALDTLPRLLTVDYKGVPWVKNVSRPYTFDYGLEGRHIVLWAGHGMVFKQKKECWDWQREDYNGILEDISNPRVAIDLVAPMLEGAGAVVWTPRERCASPTEIIIDNDRCWRGSGSNKQSVWQTLFLTENAKTPQQLLLPATIASPPQQSPLPAAEGFYTEINGRASWYSYGEGFAPIDTLRMGDNPFKRGSSRVIRSESDDKALSAACWYPNLSRSERLAVYVSYQTLANSTEHAIYSIHHAGQVTNVSVNQRMGGGTWVYLGEYKFTPGKSDDNCVILTNKTSDGGAVSADAVRFGGGMGNTLRGMKGKGKTRPDSTFSGLTRYLEGARYSMQWAGMPDSVYACYKGDDDYKEDLNVRSYATNRLCAGSIYNPNDTGLNVPVELTIAMHTDAGVDRDGKVVGSLGIATTYMDGGTLASGCSRMICRDLAEEVLGSVCNDMQRITGAWNRRHLLDRNYSETRRPVVPATIIEMASHENPTDARLFNDSTYRFHIARAIYKGILRFVYRAHSLGSEPVIQPLPVSSLSYNGSNVTWMPTVDALEPTATTSCYLVQVAFDDGDFDNGQLLNINSYTLKLKPGQHATVRVRPINAGGAGMWREIRI